MVGLSTNYLNPMWQGTKSFSSSYLHFVMGVDQSTVFSEELMKSVRGVKDPATKKRVNGKGFKKFGESIDHAWTKSKKVVEGKSFLEVLKKSFKSMPSEFKAASRLAKMTGKKSKLMGSTFKILGKRMPFIANVVMLGMEIPNLYKAFTEGGLGAGLKETGKSAFKFGGFAAGAAIGQALIPIPFFGAIIGGMVGGWISEKIVGKSFTEKKEEAEEEAKAGVENQETEIKTPTETETRTAENQAPSFTGNTNAMAFNPATSNPFNKQDYMDKDFMAMGAGLV